MSVLFFQSTKLGGVDNQPGLFDLFITHLDNIEYVDIFETQQIVTPNHASSSWLKDQIALKYGICANLDFIVLLGPVLQNIYLANNKDAVIFEMANAKYIIYNYLCNTQINTIDSLELNNYLYNKDNQIDHYKCYQLSSQLATIISEYIYLRTDELLDLKSAKLKIWQKQIIEHLFSKIGSQKTFLDIYQFFHQLQSSTLLPKRLFIFGLTSIYPSQLMVLLKIAEVIDIYWYYQAPSNEYYGDLLSDYAKSKLERKILREPNLSLDDLYLVDGNPLLANLGQQSREFIELLNAYDIDIYKFGIDYQKTNKPDKETILSILQHDIWNLKYRVRAEYRLQKNKIFYAKPIELKLENNGIYDLSTTKSSIKVNVCHNQMREVQVMFNEIVSLLNHENAPKLSEILITAPDIDDYAPYIQAVFTNEFAVKLDGSQYNIPYNITGQRKYNKYKPLEAIKAILDTPYNLTANYFIQLVTQSVIQNRLRLTDMDIDLIKKWLADNLIHFGYDEKDYMQLGYVNYPTHSFKRFLDNLVLGSCMGGQIFAETLPIYKNNNQSYTPYDNLDSNQIDLCNKLIIIINLLRRLRDAFYNNDGSFKLVTVDEVHQLVTNIFEIITTDDESGLIMQDFLGCLLKIETATTITLPILISIIEDYLTGIKTTIRFNGSITAASMRYMRNIPFSYVYILGLNFGEYPIKSDINQLSILSHEWYLADRNYNIESKQTFLDIILNTKVQLVMSYIGRTQTDNQPINPSPVLSLFLNTLGQSFSDFWLENSVDNPQYNFKNLFVEHHLHPFYKSTNFFWAKASKILTENASLPRFEFGQVLHLDINNSFYNITLKELQNTFLYTNSNLYKVLKINTFNNDIELSDTEDLSVTNRNIARTLFYYFEQYNNTSVTTLDLQEYLITAGILGYNSLGDIQFNYYHDLYKRYIKNRGSKLIKINFNEKLNENLELNFSDEFWCEDNVIIIMDGFERFDSSKNDNKIPYRLQIKAMITLAIVSKHLPTHEVIIRLSSTENKIIDYKMKLSNSDIVFDKILKYYIRSLSNPVLIHEDAILEYVAQQHSKWPSALEDKMAKIEQKYLNDYNNFKLDALKNDIIFGNIATEYFSLIRNVKGHNDIYSIGNMLNNLQS